MPQTVGKWPQPLRKHARTLTACAKHALPRWCRLMKGWLMGWWWDISLMLLPVQNNSVPTARKNPWNHYQLPISGSYGARLVHLVRLVRLVRLSWPAANRLLSTMRATWRSMSFRAGTGISLTPPTAGKLPQPLRQHARTRTACGMHALPRWSRMMKGWLMP